MTGSEKPNVLIFGGLNTCSRTLAAYLVPLEGDSLVSQLRIVDKFSVRPATTYLGSEFPKVLEKDNVEYKQANLTVPATVSQMFDPPEGQQPYQYVFDFTGEIRHDRPDQVQIQQTLSVSRLIGTEAAKRGVKAYVRWHPAVFDTPEKGSHDEKESIKPRGVQGVWWQETLRALAAIKDLNLVIIRTGFCYGPYIEGSLISLSLAISAVYGYLKKPFLALWSPGKHPMHTVHAVDVAGAMWAAAQWMAGLGRAEADVLAGEEIQANDKSKIKEGKDLPEHNTKLVAPLFNIVDDSNSTLLSMGQANTALFGTTFAFYDFLTSTMAKVHLTDSTIEDINEEHGEPWATMLTTSNPPITNPSITCYADREFLEKHTLALSNAKIKNVVGYKLQYPQYAQETLRDIVEKWKAEHTWPNVDAPVDGVPKPSVEQQEAPQEGAQ